MNDYKYKIGDKFIVEVNGVSKYGYYIEGLPVKRFSEKELDRLTEFAAYSVERFQEGYDHGFRAGQSATGTYNATVEEELKKEYERGKQDGFKQAVEDKAYIKRGAEAADERNYKTGYIQGYVDCRQGIPSKFAKIKLNGEVKQNVNYSEDDLKKEYKRGLEEAWELGNKIMEWPTDKRAEILGIPEGKACFPDILYNFTAEEVIKKIQDYERRKEDETLIRVGDEVDVDGRYKAIVIEVKPHYWGELLGNILVLLQHSGHITNESDEKCEKTGKHYEEIDKLLEKLQREEND